MQVVERDGLTAAEVEALIVSTTVDVSAGVDLLDSDDSEVDSYDLSSNLDPSGSSVSCANYATIHRTCRLVLTGVDVEWGSQRLRPWVRLTDSKTGATARFNLGVYLPETPVQVAGDTPATVVVEGYDKLTILDTSPGYTVHAAAAVGHLARAKALIEEADPSAVVLVEDFGDDLPIPTDRVWPIDERNTYLLVVNDLLAAAGRRGVWVDWNGRYRFDRYVSSSERAPEWAYDSADDLTIVAEDAALTVDLWGVPNRWVFVRDDPQQDSPVPGDGVYTVDNVSDGPSSQDARGGRVITRIVRLQAADQASLEVQGDRLAAEDRRVARFVEWEAAVNPLHWHFDVVHFSETAFGVAGNALVESWELPLTGDNISVKAKVL